MWSIKTCHFSTDLERPSRSFTHCKPFRVIFRAGVKISAETARRAVPMWQPNYLSSAVGCCKSKHRSVVNFTEIHSATQVDKSGSKIHFVTTFC